MQMPSYMLDMEVISPEIMMEMEASFTTICTRWFR